jgi:hypothetical protein
MQTQVKTEEETSKPINLIASKVINLVVTEMNKSDMQTIIRKKIILPVINMIYAELYPYIIALSITVCIILLLSLMTFMFFVLYYFKK